jgi:hypothetical protein
MPPKALAEEILEKGFVVPVSRLPASEPVAGLLAPS